MATARRRRKKRPGEVLRSGVCFKCGGPAAGGRLVRRGVEMERVCPSCLRKPSERDLYLNHKQATALITAAAELGQRHELLVAIGLNLGTRISEAVAMKGTDFDWEEDIAWISTLKQKGTPKKPVYMSEGLQLMLKRLVGPRVGFLFPRLRGGHGWKKGGHVSRWTGERLYRAAADRAGIPEKLSAHAMRHYAAIKTLEATGDLYFTSRQLRHGSLATTQRYLHLLPARARELAAAVPVTSRKK